MFITGGAVGAGGSAPVPGPGAGEVLGARAGALAGVDEADVEVPELDVTPPQFPSTITNSATNRAPRRRMALLLSGNILYPRRSRLQIGVKMARLSALLASTWIFRELPRAAETQNAQLRFPLLFWISTTSVDRQAEADQEILLTDHLEQQAAARSNIDSR